MAVFCRRVVPLVVSFAACLIACSTPPPESVGSASQAIQGADTDPEPASTFAVALCPNGACAGVCSGVLVAPNLVLTARHCVQETTRTGVECSNATFGKRFYDFAGGSPLITTAATVRTTKTWYKGKIVRTTPLAVCGNDLAAIILTSSIPASEAVPVTPAVRQWITNRAVFAKEVVAIGYGLSDPQGAGSSGTRRKRGAIPISCIPGDAELPCKDLVKMGLDEREFVVAGGMCDGDSGGAVYDAAAFQRGEHIALGVLSRGGVTDGQCTSNVITRFDANYDFIMEVAKEAAQTGGYPLPSWVGPQDPKPVVPDAGPPPGRAAGESCTNRSDCTSGRCGTRDGTTFVCADPCSTDGTCAAGHECVPVEGSTGLCFTAAPVVEPPKPKGCACALLTVEARGGRDGVLVVAAGVAAVALGRRRRRAPRS